MYKEYKINFETSFYLQRMKIVYFRNIIAKIRLSFHDLNIEQGRHRLFQGVTGNVHCALSTKLKMNFPSYLFAHITNYKGKST